jgi:hypothetical protein
LVGSELDRQHHQPLDAEAGREREAAADGERRADGAADHRRSDVAHAERDLQLVADEQDRRRELVDLDRIEPDAHERKLDGRSGGVIGRSADSKISRSADPKIGSAGDDAAARRS